jgi:rfaE bifunctional protein nucleotidyltransferase chain/domain
MKIVLVHGVFDLLHVGHLAHLEEARKYGDRLVVSVVLDAFITKSLPIYPEHDRIRLLRSLRCVDRVIQCEAPGPEAIIERLCPDIYVRGADYLGKEMPESSLLNRLGIPICYTHSIPPRTSEVIERIRCR